MFLDQMWTFSSSHLYIHTEHLMLQSQAITPDADIRAGTCKPFVPSTSASTRLPRTARSHSVSKMFCDFESTSTAGSTEHIEHRNDAPCFPTVLQRFGKPPCSRVRKYRQMHLAPSESSSSSGTQMQVGSIPLSPEEQYILRLSELRR